jgi:hypothetical protein
MFEKIVHVELSKILVMRKILHVKLLKMTLSGKILKFLFAE